MGYSPHYLTAWIRCNAGEMLSRPSTRKRRDNMEQKNLSNISFNSVRHDLVENKKKDFERTTYFFVKENIRNNSTSIKP